MFPCQHDSCLHCLVEKYQGKSNVECAKCKLSYPPSTLVAGKMKNEVLMQLEKSFAQKKIDKLNEEKSALAVIKAKLKETKSNVIEFDSGGPHVIIFHIFIIKISHYNFVR